MHRNFLIIGQGLAGSLVGLALIENEQTVTIVDNANPQSASRVAAGLMNPISGQRMVLAPDVLRCLPFAIERYAQLSNLLHRSFYHTVPLLRLYQNKNDKDRYRSRKQDGNYLEFLGKEFEEGQSGEPVSSVYAGFFQHQTGYLDMSALLESSKEYFRERGALVELKFNYDDLIPGATDVSWQGQQFDEVIFCEGASAVDNPWFRWLPFQLSKGELITVRSNKDFPKTIVNKGYWLLPQQKGEAKIGATYQWEWSDENPSYETQQELFDACCEMLADSSDISITNHQAGIRPTTKDKQPFIGTHPQYVQLHCCNGFGSRGAMLAPFYVGCLVEKLLNDALLPAEVDINRFQQNTSLVIQARRFVSEKINPGDVVIDATVGNGHDTELLARCVGEHGRVIGFDIQETAINNTKQRLKRMGLLSQVTLVQADHAHMTQHLSSEHLGIISLIVFNLGFLPGSDKRCVTKEETTIAALIDAISVIKTSGVIVLMTYSGHECGKKETKSVLQWMDQLDKDVFHIQTIETQQKIDAPALYIITKT